MVTRPFSKKRQTIYFGLAPKTVLRPYMKKGRPILGSGKRKKTQQQKFEIKTKGKQNGGWASLAAAALP